MSGPRFHYSDFQPVTWETPIEFHGEVLKQNVPGVGSSLPPRSDVEVVVQFHGHGEVSMFLTYDKRVFLQCRHVKIEKDKCLGFPFYDVALAQIVKDQ